jgi:UDP-galactopyranose mutase
MFIEKYTRKMWRVEDETVIDDFTWSPKGVAIKRGPREGWDNAISAYPRDLTGYDPLFEKAEKVAQIRGGCRDVKVLPGTTTAIIDGETQTFDIIINTAPLDDIFDSKFGPLAYVGRRIEYLVLPVENALPKNVYFCYYTSNEPYTRCVEYKKFTGYQSASTLISLEYPSADGKYYPLPVSAEKHRHQEYMTLQHSNMRSVGRLGLYNYRFDIDDAVEQAREAVDILG